MGKVFTQSQQNVIDFRGKNMLVSASAGTGKTTVMIERIVSLIEEGADVSQIVVVTFTNLAAAEMKSRLASKLSEKRNNPRIIEQLEKLDSASICTLHSFCSDLLRNYFYVVDIDPAFSILDNVTVTTLRKNTLDDLFAQYFAEKDDVFRKVYKIFSTYRQEDNFKDTLLRLYDFSRCIDDFDGWYSTKLQNFLTYSETNPVVTTLKQDIVSNVAYYKRNMSDLAKRCDDVKLPFGEICLRNAELLGGVRFDTLQNAMFDLCKLQLENLPAKGRKAVIDDIEEKIRLDFTDLKKSFDAFALKYAKLCRGENIETLWEETRRSTVYTDKLVEIIGKFDEAFFQAKKQRGGIDFNDLEHLTLKLLRDSETLGEIKSRYRLIFVDEYQDTNPVQEAIISTLSQSGNLFMVGDVKQSIYGFRGCEPSIFMQKYDDYKATDIGKVEELNDNFRSNSEILDFVNSVFNSVMTADFGKVDYQRTSQLKGATPPCLKTPSTRIDFVLSGEREQQEIDFLYDITAEESEQTSAKQGELIAKRIKQYVGMAYRDKDGRTQRIGYGDIVILMRSLTNKAIDIYNTLIAHNIPVAANFKLDGLSVKEVRDLINLLRVIDNPYNDMYVVGVSLTPFGGFSESELGIIRLDTPGRIPFYERMKLYAESGADSNIVAKINAFFNLLNTLRFYSRSASVSEVALKVLQLTNYHLYVEGLPNGGLRLRKLYAFIDSVKDANYAESIDKFLAFIDESDDNRAEEGLSQTNAVRLMTMHASKGLEFPIVFVAGVESRFNSDPHAIETNAQMGLAIRNYNFDNMRVSDTLGATACGMFNRTKQLEEEMRLLYVAMTRAKFVLNIVGVTTKKQLDALPKLPTRANSHLDWLMLAMKQKINMDCNFADIVAVEAHENLQNITTSEQGAQGYLCEQITDKTLIDKQLGYRYPHLAETEMPSKIVSSALDKEYIAISDEPHYEHTLNADNDRNFVGTAYHKVYQYVNYTASLSEITATINELVNDGKIEQRFADKLDVELIYNTLNNPELKRLLNCGQVYHEIPFMLNVPYDQVAKDKRFTDVVMLQGVIDLLVIDRKGNSATVIDFKYTLRSDLVEQNYTAQLNSYKLAVQRICGIDNVSCFVLSIADNKLIKMS